MFISAFWAGKSITNPRCYRSRFNDSDEIMVEITGTIPGPSNPNGNLDNRKNY